MNQQTVNELTHLYTALNPTPQSEKPAQVETKEISPVLVKIENWLENSRNRISQGIGSTVKDNRVIAAK